MSPLVRAAAGGAAAPFAGLAGSTGSRSRGNRPRSHVHGPRRARERERGIALVLTLTTLAILAVVLADMHENTSTSFALAATQRDQLKAEYMARSGMNLTRLLVAQEEPIRQLVTPFYQSMIGRPPPQLPIWTYANEVLRPFCDFESAQGLGAEAGVNFSMAEGLGGAGASCGLLAFAENSKVNVNDPLHHHGDPARLNVAMQVFALTGGYQQPSPYDPLFERRDPDGLITTRLDMISALIDWWDVDSLRTTFEPGASTVTSSGAEDDVYARFRDPYPIKNAPFDSVEELRMIRGVGDDFWATFVEPDPDDPTSRSVTVYGSGAVNPNEARPDVLLARTCSFLPDQPLCMNPMEAAKFIQLMNTVRMLAPVPWFSRVEHYFQFLQGRGGPMELYPMLQMMLGPDNPLLFVPVQIPPDRLPMMGSAFVTAARILTVQSTGYVGNCDIDMDEQPGRCTRVRLRAILNTDPAWVPPPPNAGAMPRMGIYHHWRVD